MVGKFLGSIDKRVLGWLFALAVFGYVGYTQVDESSKDETERSESGDVVAEGDIGVFVLRIGDCLNLPPDEEGAEFNSISTLSAVPCQELHDAEVIGKRDLALTDFPGAQALSSVHSEFCFDEYGTYTGVAHNSDSPHFVYSIFPTEETWSEGDREVVCLASMWDGSQLGASIRG